MNRIGLIIVAVGVFMLWGCGASSNKDLVEAPDNEVVQSSDGNILLDIDDAYLFNDEANPDRNTAEWDFMVKNKGRYEVWISSLTCDTMDLGYKSPVIVNFGDKRIEGKPVGDEIVGASNDDKHYFRADSKLGSIYIEDAGHYNIQVISEKVVPEDGLGKAGSAAKHTYFDQLVLKPLTN